MIQRMLQFVSFLCIIVLILFLQGCVQTVRDASEVSQHSFSKAQSDPPQLDPQIQAIIAAAEFAWQDGRKSSAARHFTHAALLTKDVTVMERAVYAALAAQEWELARQVLQHWQKIDKNSVALQGAQLALMLGEQPSTALYAKILDLWNQRTEAAQRSVTQMLVNNADAAQSIALLTYFLQAKQLSTTLDGWLLLSQIAQGFKHRALTEQFAHRALQHYSENAKAHAWLAHLAIQQEDLDTALTYLNNAARLDPEHREIALTRAAVLDELGQHAEAEQALRHLKLDIDIMTSRVAYATRSADTDALRAVYDDMQALPLPYSSALLLLLGQTAELLKEYEAAMSWYTQIPMGESYMGAQFRIAAVYDGLKQYEKAHDHLNTLRMSLEKNDPFYADSYLLEGELLKSDARYTDALALYETGLIALPDNREILYARALLLDQMGSIDRAIQAFKELTEIFPDDPDALNALGYILIDRTNRYAEALPYIERALALKPKDPAIIDSMGWLHFRQGQHQQALALLEKAYQLMPDAEVGAHLGEVLWTLGKQQQARRVWQAAHQKNPKSPTLLDTLARFWPEKIDHTIDESQMP